MRRLGPLLLAEELIDDIAERLHRTMPIGLSAHSRQTIDLKRVGNFGDHTGAADREADEHELVADA